MARGGYFWIILLCGAARVQSLGSAVSPVEKVIELLEGLLSDIEAEGKEEAETYSETACFCKDKNQELADRIKEEQDAIEEYSATMQQQRAISDDKGKAVADQTAVLDKLNAEIAEIQSKRDKEKGNYDQTAADLQAGVEGLEGAIEDAEAGTSELQLDDGMMQSLVIADTLDLVPKKSKDAVAGLLQTGDDGDYETHSEDLIEIFRSLDQQFIAKKAEVDQMEDQNKKNFEDVMATKTGEKQTLEDAIAADKEEKDNADKSLGEATDSMLEQEQNLKEDKYFLKETTDMCELKAREWDQHAEMRKSESDALSKALDIIKMRVKSMDEAANKRALLQDQPQLLHASKKALSFLEVAEDDVASTALSFLEVANPRQKLRSLALAHRAQAHPASGDKQSIIERLMHDSRRLKSPTLALLALRVGADPFKKVKKLIQQLIERLVQEAADEASKKGWCDTEMSKATYNRNNNMGKVKKLNAETANLEAWKSKLEEEIDILDTDITSLTMALAKQTKIRALEKIESADTIDKAKAGQEACKEALEVLKSFYKQASKAKVLLVQRSSTTANATSHVKTSLLQKQTPSKGNQQASASILDMLEVIIGDFERTIKVTTKTEKESYREFKSYEQSTKVVIASKSTTKSNSEFNLKETNAKLQENMNDLEKHQKLLDDALKELEDLKPSCVDTGMSYEERVQKRKEEIDALNDALCQLDPEQVEDECQ